MNREFSTMWVTRFWMRIEVIIFLLNSQPGWGRIVTEISPGQGCGVINPFTTKLGRNSKYCSFIKYFENEEQQVEEESLESLQIQSDNGWVDWGEWSFCSETCGSGVRQRSRACSSTDPANDCPGSILMMAYCNSKGCRANGGWSEWSEWMACDSQCKIMNETRYRTCDNPSPKLGGLPCPGSDLDFKDCSLVRDCPVNGQWSVWSFWDICQPTFGSTGAGTQTRTRTCTSPRPSNGGNSCVGEDNESKLCFKGDAEDGGWGSYSGWSDCYLPELVCGDNGERWLERNCVNPKPRFGGIPCSGIGTVYEACNIDCTSTTELRLTGIWGTTGPQQECLNGHFVTAFKTKISLNQGITGVRLQCNDPGQEEIYSLEHPDGNYGEFVHSCPGGYTKIKGLFQPHWGDLIAQF
ncbi:semaphorin-5B-like isoform X2 [Tigriopus californicus]|uniref:semaphorin-5B-like isoform X2 n=1 Tax=Tigriopus californicus TaxID=6832 RepID=UPI0027DAA72E|nr:semaphorin-5B-like isoform X2 [Tigriopus californicus]